MEKYDTGTTLELIDQLIEWYDEHSATASVGKLLDCQDKLSTLSWNLAELSGTTKEDYTYKYFIRKIEVNKTAQALIKSNAETAMNKAISRSETTNKNLIENEIKAEAAAYIADIKLKQVNRILSVMSQRISHAKKLFELNQYIEN